MERRSEKRKKEKEKENEKKETLLCCSELSCYFGM